MQSAAVRGSTYFALYWTATALYMPYMNLEFSRRGFTGVQIGTVGSIRALAIILAAPLLSRLADRTSSRVKMLSWSMFVSGFVLVLLMFPQTFGWLVGVMVLLAVVNAPIDSLGNAITIRMASKYHIDFALMTFWGALLYAIMNMVGGVLWQKMGFHWIYIISGVVYVLTSIATRRLDEPKEEEAEALSIATTAVQSDTKKKKTRLKPSTLIFLGAYLLFDIAFFVAYSFTAPYMDSLGASEFLIGMANAMVGVGGMIARGGNRRLLAKFKLHPLMIFSIVVSVFPMLVYGFSRNVILIVIFSIVRGAGWALFSLGTIKFIDEQAAVEHAGTLQSMVVMLSTLGSIAGNMVAGSLFDHNPVLIYAVSSSFLAVSLLVLIIVPSIRKREEALVRHSAA